VEGVRLFNEHDFFECVSGSTWPGGNPELRVFESGSRNSSKQATHTLDVARWMKIGTSSDSVYLVCWVGGLGEDLVTNLGDQMSS
jgi:hypothetical protein